MNVPFAFGKVERIRLQNARQTIWDALHAIEIPDPPATLIWSSCQKFLLPFCTFSTFFTNNFIQQLFLLIGIGVAFNLTPRTWIGGFSWCTCRISIRAGAVMPVFGLGPSHQPEDFGLRYPEIHPAKSHLEFDNVTAAAALRVTEPISGFQVHCKIIVLPSMDRKG